MSQDFSSTSGDGPGDLWLVSYGDTDDRELTSAQIARALARKEITRNTIVWRDGMPEWLPISAIPSLALAVAQAPRPEKQKTVMGGFAAAPSVPSSGPEATPAATTSPVEDLDSAVLESLVDVEPPEAEEDAITRQLPDLRVLAPTEQRLAPQGAESVAEQAEELQPESLPSAILESTVEPLGADELPTNEDNPIPAAPFDAEIPPSSGSMLESDAPTDARVTADPEPLKPAAGPALDRPAAYAPRGQHASPPATASLSQATQHAPIAGSGLNTAVQQADPLRAPSPWAERISAPPPEPERSKLPWILLILLLLAGVGGGAFWLGRSSVAERAARASRSEPIPPPPAPSITQPVPAPSASSSVAAEPEESEAAAEEPSTAPPAAQESPAPASRRVQPAERKRSAPTPPPQEEEEPEPAPAPVVGEFDRNAAARALNLAAAKASSCRKEGDPSGMANVSIIFGTSGSAERATISGPPFSGTATGGCIAEQMRSASVPPFVGARVTVKKRVVIQ